MRVLVKALLAGCLVFGGCAADDNGSNIDPEVGNGGKNAGSGGNAGSNSRNGGATGRGNAAGAAGSSSGGAGGSNGGSSGAGGSNASSGGAGGAAAGSGGANAGPDAGSPDPVAMPDAGAADATPPAAGDHYPGHPALASIFDGKTFDGWEGSAGVWKVRDGLLVGGGQRGQATTTESYGSFRLIVSSRLSKGNDHLGICLWGTKKVFDCLLVIPPSGSIYDYVSNRTERGVMYDPDAKRTWHETEIIANLQTGVVKVAVDGKAREDYKDRMIARRKAGPIGLQLHSGGIEVEFRGLYIEKDPPNDAFVTVKP